MDELSANYGKKYVQEDSITHSNHGSIITSFEMLGDQNRLEPIGNMGELYQPKTLPFIITCIHEILSCYKSIRQQSAIKLVIFDIDDTLWRGVGAEMDDVDASMGEGWPLGIVEAASCLWKRGIMIAIVSKNDEENVKRMWTRIYGDRFNLENFVVKRINWRPKAENIEEIISLINVLPSSVLFVDDNPVERAAVKAVFPDIRTLDAPLVEWRRILLWSAETQPAVITSESLARTDMVKGQIEREKVRSEMTQGEFLKRLDIKISPLWIDSESHGKFERCFELLNKTNQFNSTGQRWSKADVMSYFAKSGVFIALEVRDRFTEYGLVALALVLDDEITQVVMSCRVIGLGVERALFSEISARKMNFLGEIKALVRETGKNALIIDAFQRSGFERRGDVFINFDKAALSAPDHVGVL
jgi:FkbH-like protein